MKITIFPSIAVICLAVTLIAINGGGVLRFVALGLGIAGLIFSIVANLIIRKRKGKRENEEQE